MTLRGWRRLTRPWPVLMIAGGCEFLPPSLAVPFPLDIRVEGVVLQTDPSPDAWVTVSTPTNLERREQTRAVFDTAVVSRCRSGRFTRHLVVTLGYLVPGEARRRSWEFSPADRAAMPPGADGRFRYSFPMELSNEAYIRRYGTAGHSRTYIPHDLTRDAMDLCFIIQGGTKFGLFTSPTFVLPYALIADALARAGLPHAPVP